MEFADELASERRARLAAERLLDQMDTSGNSGLALTVVL